MRISSAWLHQQGVAAMQKQQVQLAQTQNQIAANSKWTRAADNPAGYASAEGLDRLVAQTKQYESNAAASRHRLLLEEGALAQGVDLMQHARELVIQANSAGQSPESRATLAKELAGLREQLLAVANTDDGQGRYLFAGSADAAAPFSWSGGAAHYAGDSQVRSAQIGSARSLAEGDAGSDVFMNLKTGNGRFSVTADTANTGTAQLTAARTTDAALWDGGTYSVSFTTSGYEVRDASNSLIESGSYTAGDTIRFRGAELSFSGAPAAGDQFEVSPSTQQDAMALIDRLAKLLVEPQDTAAQRAQFQTAMQQGLSELDAATTHFSDLRAGVGLRLGAVDDAIDQLGARKLQAQSALSELRDLDVVEAASRLQQQLATMQAAQQVYARVQGLSLFDYLR